MGRKAKVEFEQKIRSVEDYLSGKKAVSQICSELKVNKDAFSYWLRRYQLKGAQGLQTISKNTHYPESIKLRAVSDYKNGIGSLNQICSKYDISSNSILRKWIKKYNGHETFKSHNSKGDKCMTMGRKTTFEERVDIVSFCIANNYNYQMTADKFQISYQQIYSWVRKYEEYGSESLTDRRGKRNDTTEMSETQKLTTQLKLIEAENNRLKMELDYLKKLDEIERRR